MTRPALALLTTLAVLPAAVPQDHIAPPPRVKRVAPHSVVRVSPPGAPGPAEVAVAINPTAPDHVVVSSFQGSPRGRRYGNNHTYNSLDGGRTWAPVPCPNPEGRIQGDDSLAFGPDGTLYHCYLSLTGIREPHPLRAASGLFVRRSADGLTFHPPVPVVDHVNTVEPTEDKPWVAADTAYNSPHRGNLYVAWTRFDKYGSRDPEHRSRIWLARSRDGGKAFNPPAQLSDKSGTCHDDSSTVEGAVPAVGPNGEVYVAWAGPHGIQIDKSADGGFTWGKDVKVADQTPGWDYPAPGFTRHNGMPVTACAAGGRDRGSVYVLFADRRHGDSDVFVAASRDGAKTWAAPVRVNDDPVGNGRDQLFAWLAVDPVDGSLNVVFFDRRDGAGPRDTRTAVTLARSVDGGRTFANYRVNLPAFAASPGVFAGDYNGIAAHAGRVVAAFPHFVGPRELVVSAALFRFRFGSLDVLPAD